METYYTIYIVYLNGHLRQYPFAQSEKSEAIDFASYWGGELTEFEVVESKFKLINDEHQFIGGCATMPVVRR